MPPKANAKADQEQRDIVVKNRGDVAKQQNDGIEQAYDQVNAFNKEADTEHTAARKEMGDKVKDFEGKARKELDKGETDAEAEKAAGEKKAEEKKKKLEEEEEDESWWDRAKRGQESGQGDHLGHRRGASMLCEPRSRPSSKRRRTPRSA